MSMESMVGSLGCVMEEVLDVLVGKEIDQSPGPDEISKLSLVTNEMTEGQQMWSLYSGKSAGISQ